MLLPAGRLHARDFSLNRKRPCRGAPDRAFGFQSMDGRGKRIMLRAFPAPSAHFLRVAFGLRLLFDGEAEVGSVYVYGTSTAWPFTSDSSVT